MNNLTFLALNDKYQFKYLFKYPFRYVIQLWSGAKKDHCAFYLEGFVYEYKFDGAIITPYHIWLEELDPQTKVSAYEFLEKISPTQINTVKLCIYYLYAVSHYSIMEYVFSKIPLLNKIKFEKDTRMFCNKFYLRTLQLLDFIPADINCANYNVDDVPDLLGDLIGGRQVIR